MSVVNINENTILEDNFSQHLDYNFELKELYGEIFTRPFLINFLMLLKHVFKLNVTKLNGLVKADTLICGARE